MTTRVTHRTVTTQALANLQNSLGASQKLSDRLSSGKLIQKPSDDPAGTVTALQIRADIRAQQQFTRNGDDAIGWLTQADSSLMDASTSLRRATDLVLRGANTGANGPDARRALAVEIENIRDGLLQTANATYLNRPVFGGTTGSDKAFEGASFVDGGGQPAPYRANGVGSVERSMAPGVSVRADTNGVAVFGEGEQSVFALLDRVAKNLVDKPDALQSDLTEIAGFAKKITNALADVGARYNRVETLKSSSSSAVLDLNQSLSGVENIDLPKTIMELQMQQVAYQAALGATAKVIQPSLMDFLR